MYGSLFCRLYNEFGWNEYPRAFGAQLLEWLARHGAATRTVVDLGCGTGVLCDVLRAGGLDARGVDLSEDMIAIARRQYPEIRFDVGDMTAWRPETRCDLVTCTGDALNHIADPEDVSRVFENVHAALNDGGYFVFDLLDPAEVPEGEPFEADDAEGRRVRFQADRSGASIRLRVEVREGGGPGFDETILEYLHDPDDVTARLERAGFEIVQCADRLLTDSDAHGTTWFIVARRAKG